MNIGTRLGHYRILEPLGKGGMGEVYVAEDTRLHRKVAIKVLSGLVNAAAERRHRFEREAQAIAALNHPSIVTIHAVDEAGGAPFIVMELVEGQPLADLITRNGLPLDAILRVGIAVSDAIAAAHERGITHRDLKPANVMVMPDGRVKVLDFGLAKQSRPAFDADGATRLGTSDLTGEGRIIGTVAYMSPEQAEGGPVDSRSDIFSLGVVLHEMATGERPFRGDTNISIISSILKDTPTPVSDLNTKLPSELSAIVQRALAKHPSHRYQGADDLRNALQEIKERTGSGIKTTRARQSADAVGQYSMKVIAPVSAIALMLTALAIYGLGLARNRPAAFEADRLTRLTTGGNALMAAISGDGRYVAHVKMDHLRPSLWVRQTVTLSDVEIVSAAPVRYKGVSFSPDDNYVYYVSYELTGGVGTLYRVPVLGGPPQRILEDVDSQISFSPDGRQLAFMRGEPAEGRNYLMIADADGSAARQVAAAELPDQFLLSVTSWSPDGRTILVIAQSLKEAPHVTCYAVDVRSTAVSNACGRWGLVNDVEWMPDGESLVVSGGGLGIQDAQLWQITYPGGERRRVTNDLNNYVGVSLTRDGRSMATVQSETTGTVWTAPATDPMKAIQMPAARSRNDGALGLAWAPDNRLLFSSIASGTMQIWLADADGQHARQLTTGQESAALPVVSPDGRFILFQELQPSGTYVALMDFDGSNRRRLTTQGSEFFPLVGADSRTVFYMRPTTGQLRAYKTSIAGGNPVALADAVFRAADVSPDGRQLLGMTWDEANRRMTIGLLSVDGGSPQLLNLPVLGGMAWTKDGKGVTYTDIVGGRLNLWVHDLASGASRRLTNFTTDSVLAFAWSRDGAQIALVRGQNTSDVLMIAAK